MSDKEKGTRLNSEDGAAKLSVFFSLKESGGPPITMQVNSVDILSGTTWSPLISEPLVLNSAQIQSQFLLARIPLPEGTYTKVRFNLSKVSTHNKGDNLLLGLESNSIEYVISEPVHLSKVDSQSIFMIWDVVSSLVGNIYFKPNMQVLAQPIPLNTDLGYVACPEIDTIYVIRTDTNTVCGSWSVTGNPTYLDLNSSENELYVLTPGESALKVLELPSGRLKDSINLPMSSNPFCMASNPENDWMYIFDKDSSFLQILDLHSGNIVRRTQFAQPLDYLLYLPTQRRLAVSSSFTQEVFLLEPETLSIVEKVSVGRGVSGLIATKKLLYIAETSSNSVATYDLNSGKMNRNFIGLSPRRFLVNGNNVYVTNYLDGKVAVLVSGQLNMLRNIMVGGNPLEMAASPNRQWLYVGDQQKGQVVVIDLNSNRVSAFIDLGASPVGIAIN